MSNNSDGTEIIVFIVICVILAGTWGLGHDCGTKQVTPRNECIQSLESKCPYGGTVEWGGVEKVCDLTCKQPPKGK